MGLPESADFGGVPLVVPDSWRRATVSAPVPVVRCRYIFPDTHNRPGEQCKRWSLRGTDLCIKHGGQLENVRQHAEAVVESARLRLVGSTDRAVDWLLDLAENSASDAVRLKATTEVLDRAGVRGGVEVDVNVEDKRSPADVLRQKISELRERTIEGEVVRRTEDAAAQAALEAATTASEDVTVTAVDQDVTPTVEESPDVQL